MCLLIKPLAPYLLIPLHLAYRMPTIHVERTERIT